MCNRALDQPRWECLARTLIVMEADEDAAFLSSKAFTLRARRPLSQLALRRRRELVRRGEVQRAADVGTLVTPDVRGRLPLAERIERRAMRLGLVGPGAAARDHRATAGLRVGVVVHRACGTLPTAVELAVEATFGLDAMTGVIGVVRPDDH